MSLMANVFSTVVLVTWHGLFLSHLPSSGSSDVFAVQYGFSALLYHSAIVTQESISPISLLSHRWQHVTQSHVVMFLFYYYYICFFCFASQEYISFRFCSFVCLFPVLKWGLVSTFHSASPCVLTPCIFWVLRLSQW